LAASDLAHSDEMGSGGELAEAEPEVAEEAPPMAIPPAAVVDEESPDNPRRGWWSRFVRKQD
jgi:hypothetical protein